MDDIVYPTRIDSKDGKTAVQERILKLVITGDPAVGKTSLRRSFIGKNFKENYLPTLGADFSLYPMQYNNQKIKATLWDLSGQVKFRNVAPQYYVGSHGAIVLYDIHSETPEEELIAWIDTYLQHLTRFVGPVLVVQNKIDLIPEQEEAKYKISHDKLINKLRIYYDNKVDIYSARTSAKTGENVDSSLGQFIKTIADTLSQRRSQPSVASKAISRYTKAAYLITFENMVGPVIVARSPKAEHRNFTPEEEMGIVKLSAGINLEDLVSQQYDTGNASWSDPPSDFYYISFVIPNENARGNHDMYILGCNVSREMKNILATEQSIIQGYLINKMNQVSEFIDSNDYELANEQDLIRLYQSPNDLDKLTGILEKLREEVENSIQDKLQA